MQMCGSLGPISLSCIFSWDLFLLFVYCLFLSYSYLVLFYLIILYFIIIPYIPVCFLIRGKTEVDMHERACIWAGTRNSREQKP